MKTVKRMRGPACVGARTPEGCRGRRKFGKTTLMRSLLRKRFACPASPTRLAGRVARLPVGKAARIIVGKLHPDEVKLFDFGENPTTNAARCNRSKAGIVVKIGFHNNCAQPHLCCMRCFAPLCATADMRSVILLDEKKPRQAGVFSWRTNRVQRFAMSGTLRAALPLNSWRGRPILYSGSVIISSHCEIQPGVRARAKMQVNSDVGMPSARCTIPE